MHGSVGPWAEANALYVEPSRLASRLSASASGDLVLFDIGLGAAANALAAIRAALELGNAPRRRLHIISFERDIDLLAFAFQHFASFPHFAGFHDALHAALSDRTWQSPCGTIRWDLRVGDFLEMVDHETLQPDVVFHDPYSPAANPEMWNVACFEKLHRLAKVGDEPTSLFTYSCATPVRAALLLAGFFVGSGPATGRMKDTTQASTQRNGLEYPFGERWMSRWLRSHSRYPIGTRPEDFAAVTHRIVTHPQFAAGHTCELNNPTK